MANRSDLYAAKTREEIELAIKLGADINKDNNGGLFGTPFQYHCLVGNAEAVQTMVENGADLEKPVAHYESYGRTGDHVGWRPLDLAMHPRLADGPGVREQNANACVKVLLDAGASLERGLGEKPLIERAIDERSAVVIDKMMEIHGADGVSAMYGTNGASVLGLASWTQNNRYGEPSMLEHLLNSGIDPNCTDERGQPAILHVYTGHVPALLAAGADANAIDPDGGRTALHKVCAQHGDTLSPNAVTSAEALLDYGAKVDALDRNGNTPLANVARQDLAPLADLLLQRGADPRLTLASPLLQGVNHNPTIEKVQSTAIEQERQTLRQVAAEASQAQAPDIAESPAPRRRMRL